MQHAYLRKCEGIIPRGNKIRDLDIVEYGVE